MNQKDYLERQIQQLAIFLSKLLKYNIEIDQENFQISFERMLALFHKSDISTLGEISKDDLEMYVTTSSLKNKMLLVYYKAVILYSEKDKKIASNYYYIAGIIENLHPDTFEPFQNQALEVKLEDYKKNAADSIKNP